MARPFNSKTRLGFTLAEALLGMKETKNSIARVGRFGKPSAPLGRFAKPSYVGSEL
jgi:hypothetical protein